jgi:hypothetical protein
MGHLEEKGLRSGLERRYQVDNNTIGHDENGGLKRSTEYALLPMQ